MTGILNDFYSDSLEGHEQHDSNNFQPESHPCVDINMCNSFLSNSGHFRLLNLNIRSIHKNFDELLILLKLLHYNVDIIILTECRLGKLVNLKYIDGYTAYSTSNHKLQNDGVVVYVKNTYSVKKITEIDLPGSNTLQLDINVNVSILAIYRSPANTNLSPFLDALDNVLRSNNDKESIILTGDININIMNLDTSSNAYEYMNVLAEHGLKVGINSPTRVCETTQTCIDHVMFRTKKYAESMVYKNSVTDHYTILFKINIGARDPKFSKELIINRIDFDALKNDLSLENWQPVVNSANVDTAVDNFIEIVKKYVKKFSYSFTRKNKCSKPWMTNGILQSINTRDKLNYKCKKFPNNLILKDEYKKYRNHCNFLIKYTKESYYRNKLEENKNNLRETWKVIKEAANIKPQQSAISSIKTDNGLIDANQDPLSVANLFNNYFIKVGKNLADELKLSQKSLQSSNNVHTDHEKIPLTNIYLTPTTESEIFKIVLSLKNGSSGGTDGLGSDIFKKNIDALKVPLTYIVNLSLKNGVFPNKCKEGKVLPLFKGGDRNEIKNYRPISILNTLSKIIEKIVKNRLTKFLDMNEILSRNQFGFRERMGTSDAISKLSHHVLNTLDQNKQCIGVFLDLAKAFDTVCHRLLIEKLNNIGVVGKALSWFKSYLTDRTQVVHINNISSNVAGIEYGVPQGSVLGPILFNIFINDLCDLEINGNITTFADDTVVLFTGESWSSVNGICEEEMRKIKLWLDRNLLSLNVDKTKFMTFSLTEAGQPIQLKEIKIHSCDPPVSTFSCNCKPISKTHSIKYLGINLDNKLKWEEHTKVVAKKLRMSMYIFRDLRNILSIRSLKTVYFAICQSLFLYGIDSWGGCASSFLSPVEIAQKQIIKIILKKPRRCPSAEIFHKFDVLNIRQLYISSLLCKIFQKKEGYKIITRERFTRSSLQLNLSIPRMRTLAGQRCASYIGPKLFNQLDPEMKLLPKLKLFKKKLTTYLKGVDGPQLLGELP